MKAHVDRNMLTGAVRIWLYERDVLKGVTRLLLNKGGSQWEWAEVADGSDMPEPTFELHERVVEAMASALATMGRPEEATQRHLNDAISIRDRLLALVENTANASWEKQVQNPGNQTFTEDDDARR